MQTKRVPILALLLFSHLMVHSTGQEVFAQSKEQATFLPRFLLEDQFGESYSAQDFEDTILIVISSNRSASKASHQWGASILQAFLNDDVLKESLTVRVPGNSFQEGLSVDQGVTFRKKSVQIVPIADVAGVPGPLKWFVRNAMSDDGAAPVILDWEGRFRKQFDFKKDEVNLLLFSPQGRLHFQTSGLVLKKSVLDQISTVTKSLIELDHPSTNVSALER